MQKNDHDYIISGGQQGKSRLDVLSHILHDHTRLLLEQHGVAKGASFLDVGCGGGNVAAMVADMVGSHGSVTAVDFDEHIIALARQDPKAAEKKNISFETMSAYELPFRGTFDVAYARFLLSHLEEPLAVLRRMANSVKPGGAVVVEDVHFSGHFCFPQCNAFDQYVQFYMEAAKRKGADPEIGPTLFSLFHEAGLVEVGFDVIQPCFNKGEGKMMAWLTLDRIKDALVEQGISSSGAIEAMLDKLQTFSRDEHTIISLPRIFRVWGTVTDSAK